MSSKNLDLGPVLPKRPNMIIVLSCFGSLGLNLHSENSELVSCTLKIYIQLQTSSDGPKIPIYGILHNYVSFISKLGYQIEIVNGNDYQNRYLEQVLYPEKIQIQACASRNCLKMSPKVTHLCLKVTSATKLFFAIKQPFICNY